MGQHGAGNCPSTAWERKVRVSFVERRQDCRAHHRDLGLDSGAGIVPETMSGWDILVYGLSKLIFRVAREPTRGADLGRLKV